MSTTLALGADPFLRRPALPTSPRTSLFDQQPVDGALSPNAESDAITSYYSSQHEPHSFTGNLIRGDPLPFNLNSSRHFGGSSHYGTTLDPSETAETASIISHSQSAYAYSSFGGDHEPYSWESGRLSHPRSISVSNQNSDLRGLTLVEPKKIAYHDHHLDASESQQSFPWSPPQQNDYEAHGGDAGFEEFESESRPRPFYKISQPSSNEASPTRATPPTRKQSVVLEQKRKKRGPIPSKQSIPCGNCNKSFRNRSDLRRHRLKHARPFPCPFSFAGCTSTFSSKNEWARHVQTIHERIYWYRCDQPKCEVGPFNRRDLFKCHYVRAHKIPADQVEERLDNCKEEDDKAKWPTRIACGFRGTCGKVLHSPDNDEYNPSVWRDWMEHRAEHYLNEKNWDRGDTRPDIIDDSIKLWAISRKHIMEKEPGVYNFISKRR